MANNDKDEPMQLLLERKTNKTKGSSKTTLEINALDFIYIALAVFILGIAYSWYSGAISLQSATVAIIALLGGGAVKVYLKGKKKGRR